MTWKIWKNWSMENIITSFDYPIIIKHVHGFLTVSVPDLGISEKIQITKSFYKKETLNQNKDKIWNLLVNVLNQSESHVQYKKWVPDASQIKSSLKKPAKDYSLPEFQKALSQYIKVSENTIRRAIEKGQIICLKTAGGHRRIPESEIERYLKMCEINKNILNQKNGDHL